MDAGCTYNRNILDEVNAAQMWFHAKKVRPIWVKKVQGQQTIEMLEGTTIARVGDYLCRGEVGEIWPQKATLNKKYSPTNDIDADWLKYLPQPDGNGVMASRINHSFQVRSTWGQLMGQPGDFLVKHFDDKTVSIQRIYGLLDSRYSLPRTSQLS